MMNIEDLKQYPWLHSMENHLGYIRLLDAMINRAHDIHVVMSQKLFSCGTEPQKGNH